MERFNNFTGFLIKALFVIFCIGVGLFIARVFDNAILGIIAGLVLAAAIYIIFINWVKDENDIASDHTGDYQMQTQVNFVYNIGRTLSYFGHLVFRAFTRH